MLTGMASFAPSSLVIDELWMADLLTMIQVRLLEAWRLGPCACRAGICSGTVDACGTHACLDGRHPPAHLVRFRCAHCTTCVCIAAS